MRVCIPHKEGAVETLKQRSDDHEIDLCPECVEAFHLIQTKEFWQDGKEKVQEEKKHGRKARSV